MSFSTMKPVLSLAPEMHSKAHDKHNQLTCSISSTSITTIMIRAVKEAGRKEEKEKES